jgi:hypothetical protein
MLVKSGNLGNLLVFRGAGKLPWSPNFPRCPHPASLHLKAERRGQFVLCAYQKEVAAANFSPLELAENKSTPPVKGERKRAFQPAKPRLKETQN